MILSAHTLSRSDLFEKRGLSNSLPKTLKLKKNKTQGNEFKIAIVGTGVLDGPHTFELKIIKTQGANLEFVQITVSLHQAKLGPPPFRQGRQRPGVNSIFKLPAKLQFNKILKR